MKKLKGSHYALILTAAVFAASLILPLARGESPIDLGLDLSGGVIVTYRPDFSTRLETYADTLDAALLALARETLESRLYRSLNTVPDIVVRGDQTIVVSIPGDHDQQQILELVGKTYQLTLRLVTAAHDQEIAGKNLTRHGGRYLELAPPEFSGDMLDERHIRVDTGTTGDLDPGADAPRVAFRFRPPHDDAFAYFTAEHVGDELAILIDGEVQWSGTIESAIRGSGVLRGGYTLEEASDVARMLRSGSLPVSLEVAGLQAVGPTLGQEIQELGLSALTLAMALLVVLLAAAYLHRGWFLIAGTLSLFCLLFYISGIVAVFGLTLDMAGIAGLVLSVGMGMDAFILIFEALERRLGAFTREQLADHHDRIVAGLYSFRQEGRVLFHANATTAVVVALLLTSERLQSFALFIFAGILASVLTIFTTREILKHTYGLLPRGGPDLLGWLRGKRPGVFRLRRLYFALVAAGLVLTGLLVAAGLPEGPAIELGADFSEGTQLILEGPGVVLRSSGTHPIEAAISRIEERLPDVEVKRQSLGPAEDGRYLVTLGAALGGGPRGGVEGTADPDDAAKTLGVEELAPLLAAEGVTLESASSIDGKLSADRLLRSLSVLGLSFFCLALYFVVLQGPINGMLGVGGRPISPSARWTIFCGILLAVGVDVAIMAAAVALLRIDVDLAVIAAVLTVIGYSVNDSVVLWSHVRNRHRAAKEERSAAEIVSGSVDSILSRAWLTSLSTMVPALAILAVGLDALAGFAWVMIAGTLAGTLSSIFVVGSFAVRALEQQASGTAAAGARREREATRLSRREIARRLQEVE